MRIQMASPSGHPDIATLPFETPLADWHMPEVHPVLGLHRHVVRLVETRTLSYVAKELPDHLAEREFRLLRRLADERIPTVEAVAVVTGRSGDQDGLLVTRHLDYAVPYRTLLAGRGLAIPYLGDRVLDAMVGLLVRLHLVGFFWGDCSLSNTLFRRDAGALSAFVIDLETSEIHESLSAGQRTEDLYIATENVGGDLLDLKAGHQLASEIDPVAVAADIERRYRSLWAELTATVEFETDELWQLQHRLDRLHDLGYDVEELEVVTTADGTRLQAIPRVVEHGYHAQRLAALTGLETGENQARRLLNDIHQFRAELQSRANRPLSENVVAVRWLDQRFEPVLEAIPAVLVAEFEPAELYHHFLEHRWFLSEREGRDIGLNAALESYLADVLLPAADGRPDQTTGADTGAATAR